MQQSRVGRRWSALSITLLLTIVLAALACTSDEPLADQPASAQVAEQPQLEQAQSQQPQPEASEQSADSDAQQVQPSQPQTAEPQVAAPVDAQQQDDATPQADAQPPSAQDQADAAAVESESVPEGTRLIALFGDITEIVYALGAQEHLVARDTSSIYPPQAETLPDLGFAGALNAEAILEFDPTLVIGTEMAGPPGVLEQLRQAGVEVLILDELKSLDAPQIKIRIIGEALGIPQRAETQALDVDQRLRAVLANVERDRSLRVLHVYIRRGGLQLVSGEGNHAQVIIEAAGGVDAAAEAGIVGWQPLTPEALVAADPDVFLVMDRGLRVIGGVEGLLELPGMAETQAGRNQRVISMPDLYLLGFGPRLPEAIADLSEFLRSIQAEASDQ